MIMWNGKERTVWWMVKKNLIDQPLHALWGALSQLPLLLAIHWWSQLEVSYAVIAASIGAFLMAQPRELYEQWPISHWWDYALDNTFFALGGGVAAWLMMQM